MNINFKITGNLLSEIRTDLARRHPFAYERVGFIFCRVAKTVEEGWIMLAAEYEPVADEDYIENDMVGAQINSDAIRKMMQKAYDEAISVVHVHEHGHKGMPRLSGIDQREMSDLIPNFWNVRPNLPHAAVILSIDSICGYAWEPASGKSVAINDFTVVSAPMKFIRQT